jgi:1-acyl-sn-glycerol-3-phosphate acyltransferase
VLQPKVYRAEHVPADGSLLVGNHTIYGFLDLPFKMAEIWKRRRLPVRGLGDHAHYGITFWRDALTACGMGRSTARTSGR